MKLFAQLYTSLDQTNSTLEKVAAMQEYFSKAEKKDAIWALSLLSGRNLKRIISAPKMREIAVRQCKLPLWLFEESYAIVGDLAETIAKVLPKPSGNSDKTLQQWVHEIIDIQTKSDEEKELFLSQSWNQLDAEQRFVFNKLLTGSFRVGVSAKLVVKALAKYLNKEEDHISHKLMGNWDPKHLSFEELLLNDEKVIYSKPYPFYLAYPLENEIEKLGTSHEWQAEWKWDGIRGQLIARNNELFIWSRGEELVSDRFPELHILQNQLPAGTVIDGELIPWVNGRPLPFHKMQTRIARKNISKKILEEIPIVMIAYDLLEYNGEDTRKWPLAKRRQLLENIIEAIPGPEGKLMLSPKIDFKTWDDLGKIRENSREMDAEGLMLKKLDSSYEVGRKKGSWWKWKLDPYSIDAVMIYAQQGHGRRANLFTDYTFAVWHQGALVPFAKAYSGLTDKEIIELDTFIKKNTIEKFGPVRSVKAALVFEIGFEGINLSTRHKSGVALRFPRILRWRKDKIASEANTLDDLKKLL